MFYDLNYCFQLDHRMFSHDVMAAMHIGVPNQSWHGDKSVLVSQIKNSKEQPCWCPKPVLWELKSAIFFCKAIVCSNKLCIQVVAVGDVSENAVIDFVLNTAVGTLRKSSCCYCYFCCLCLLLLLLMTLK